MRTLIEIDLPMIRPALVSGALLVFVDVMKELPATILLRPFNFDTSGDAWSMGRHLWRLSRRDRLSAH